MTDAKYNAISAAESAKIDRKRLPVINEIKARLRFAGYPLADSEIVDPVRLDQVLASGSVSLENRFRIKSALRACQMLPRYS